VRAAPAALDSRRALSRVLAKRAESEVNIKDVELKLATEAELRERSRRRRHQIGSRLRGVSAR
jgi:hypothetical protein